MFWGWMCREQRVWSHQESRPEERPARRSTNVVNDNVNVAVEKKGGRESLDRGRWFLSWCSTSWTLQCHSTFLHEWYKVAGTPCSASCQVLLFISSCVVVALETAVLAKVSFACFQSGVVFWVMFWCLHYGTLAFVCGFAAPEFRI